MQTFPIRYCYRDWKETTLFERADGVRVTHVQAEFAYEGDLDGLTTLSYLMQYYPDQTGSYNGWEQFEGRFQGQPAGILLHHQGQFDPKGVDARVTSVEHTGMGRLENLKLGFTTRFEGEGRYELTLEVE